MDKNQYFLGSVGRVDAFTMVNGSPVLAFVSKTMTDQGLNTTISADDIRAGTGAPVITRFYHDVNVDITLTDVMFKEAYVETQLGTHFEASGEAYVSESHVATGHTLTVDKNPLPINFGCGASETAVWYTEEGSNEWKLATSSSGKLAAKVVTDEDNIEEGKTYCVRYLAEGVDGAKTAEIYASFVPTELHLIITTPLYAGDACSASSGSVAGEVQFDIPRFRPNGGQDFAAAMSSNQTTNLSGVALGSSNGCDTEGRGALLYTMTVIYAGESLAEQYDSLEVLDETLKVGEVPAVFGIDSAMRATRIANSLLTFTPALSAGKFATSGSTTIAAKDGSGLTTTVDVAAAS